jgi:hypothetical protein
MKINKRKILGWILISPIFFLMISMASYLFYLNYKLVITLLSTLSILIFLTYISVKGINILIDEYNKRNNRE